MKSNSLILLIVPWPLLMRGVTRLAVLQRCVEFIGP
jgi:hypothetical protein